MAKFTVDSEQIQTAVSAAQAKIETLRTEANNLTTTLTNLQSSWQGQAQVAFQGHVDSWKGMHGQLEQGMDSLNQALSAAGTHYGNAENNVVTMFAAG